MDSAYLLAPMIALGQARQRGDTIGAGHGAKHVISSTTNHTKSEQAKALGFNEVIDTSVEKLGDGVRRIRASISWLSRL